MICLPTPIETPDLDDIREAMQEAGGYGADTRTGLVGFWPGRHRGPKLLDFSGRANTGTWFGTGAHWAVDGERQGVVPTFNGENDRLSMPAGLTRNNMTLCFWMNNPVLQAEILFMDRDLYNGPNGIEVYCWLDPDYHLAVRGSGATQVVCPGTYIGAWVHVAITFVGTTATVYRNGVQDAQGAIGQVQPSAHPLLMGVYGDEVSYWYSGRLDDIRIYTRALSAAEIRHIYDCGRVAPLSDLVEPVGREVVASTTGGVVVPWHLFGRVA